MTVIPLPRPSDNTTTPQARWNEAQPRHLRIALINVETGVKPSSAGIRRCKDCRRPYIDDKSALSHCRDCRTNHHRPCEDCGTRFRNTVHGARLCQSCLDQSALF